MNSIRDAQLALDTNEFIFAIQRNSAYPSCEILLSDRLPELNIYVPLQVLVELQRNLKSDELRGIFLALSQAKTIQWDYAPASLDGIRKWQKQGAKKGDAVITAHLESAGIRYLVSENRHFLSEIPGLPFEVLNCQEVLQQLDLND